MVIDLHINEDSLLDKFPGVRTCATCARKYSGFNCYDFCKGDRSAYIPVKKLTNGDVIKALLSNFEFHVVEVYGKKFIEGTDEIYPYNDLKFEEDWWNAEYKRGEKI